MGKRDLPGQLKAKILVDFVTERGFVLDDSEGDHKLFKKPGYARVSIPDKLISTRRSSYVFQNILDATRTTRKEFAEWLNAR
jgi:predicted RNA binding protein YcfA (HicA-like mRNA interferase family)